MAKTKKKTVKKSKSAPAKPKKAKTVKRKVSRTTVAIGRPVPNFSVAATGGKTVSLADLKGQNVILYFYPKDMTPGCTIEGHEFTRLKNDFADKNTVVFGVSRDTVASHEKFKEKECYTIDLLSDTDEKLCKIFGVIKDKNMYGKIVKGIERSTFLIDAQGVLVQEWRGVKAEGHAAAVLQALV